MLPDPGETGASIYGVGVDLIEIARVAEVCEDNQRFLERTFSDGEREWSFKNKRSPYQHLAACWAAKESFFKATNLRFRYSQIEVTHEESGKPYFLYHDPLDEKVEKHNLRAHLSITHHNTHAMTTVIAEQID